MNQTQRENVVFLIRILKKYLDCNFDASDMFIVGKDQVLGLESHISRIVAVSDEKFDENNIKIWLPIIIEAINDFLDIDNFPSTPAYRQHIYEIFLDMCIEIADDYWDHSKVKDILSKLKPPVYDPAIYLIKAMHEGVSKKDVSDEFQITKRTVLNHLRRLDIKNKGKVTPLRIGGQPVYVKIKTERKYPDFPSFDEPYVERDYYTTPNTMHPFVMQYNVTQAMILLKSLYIYYTETKSEICYRMAIDIWCQLSFYGKRKILSIYGCEDAEFKEFLVEIDELEFNNKLIVFEPEEVFLNEKSYACSEEQIRIAYKDRSICRVVFITSSKKETLYGRRILKDNKGFFAVPQSDVVDDVYVGKSDKVYLNSEEVKCIIKEN